MKHHILAPYLIASNKLNEEEINRVISSTEYGNKMVPAGEESGLL